MIRLWRFFWRRVLTRLGVRRATIVSAMSAALPNTLYWERAVLALQWCDLKIDIVEALLGKKVE